MMKFILISVIALALFGGLYLAISIFSGKKPPLSAAKIHGIVALILLILVAYYAIHTNSIKLWIALGLLLAASGGGLYLVNNHKKGSLGPKSAIVIHMIAALIGILFILTSIL